MQSKSWPLNVSAMVPRRAFARNGRANIEAAVNRSGAPICGRDVRWGIRL